MTGRIARPLILAGVLAAGLATIRLSAGPRLIVLVIAGGGLLAVGELTARFDERRRFSGYRRQEREKRQELIRLLGDLGLGAGLAAVLAGLAWALVTLAAAGSGSGVAYLLAGVAGLLVAVGALGSLAGQSRLRR